MPTLPIDDAGNVLYFEDSGPPPNASIYTTIVLIHGLIFHGGNTRFPVIRVKLPCSQRLRGLQTNDPSCSQTQSSSCDSKHAGLSWLLPIYPRRNGSHNKLSLRCSEVRYKEARNGPCHVSSAIHRVEWNTAKDGVCERENGPRWSRGLDVVAFEYYQSFITGSCGGAGGRSQRDTWEVFPDDCPLWYVSCSTVGLYP